MRIKVWLKAVGLIVAVILIAVIGYILYMQINYYRIEDRVMLEVEDDQKDELQSGVTYTALTYNIGFGAYSRDYSFFMDQGIMKDGTKTRGKYGKAVNKEATETNVSGSAECIRKQNPDIILLQEVDVKADRSYHIDEAAYMKDTLSGYGSVFINNFHTSYILYPFSDPHGAVNSGLMTLSRYKISEAERRSYPIDTSFFAKFTDLDRCFAIQRLPVNNGKDLVLINSHMSAYDQGGKSREQQLALLNTVLEEEYQKGNYVIVGGDYNHALGSEVLEAFTCEQEMPDWVSVLEDSDLTDGFGMVKADNQFEVATCRGSDIPYEKDVTFTTVVDGFIVSENVSATAHNIDEDFMYSDHNPVQLEFILK